jgi:hypothetical protein
MSKDPLKEIIEQRYKNIQDQKAEEAPDPDAITTDIYVPKEIKKKSYIVKLQYNLVIDGFILNKDKSNAKILDMVEIDQKVITRLYKKDQENLKYYFDKSKRKA